MMKRIQVLLAVVLAAVCARTALAAAKEPVFTSSFAKPPAAALKALKATIGKPFKAGFVFVDGKYLPPPYTVERYGTVLRINGVQVTGEVIAWDEFIKTQAGVTVSKQESAVADDPEPPEPEDDFEEEDDSESSLDDLFDDDPAPKKAKKPAARRRPRPRPKKPTVTVSYSFDGVFEPNEKTRAYVDKINAARTRVDKLLRAGGYYCFGSRYAAVSGDEGSARHLIEKLPAIMRESSTPAAFNSAVFAAGFSYLPQALMADLYRHRYSYPLLLDRRRAMEEERKWSAILGNGR